MVGASIRLTRITALTVAMLYKLRWRIELRDGVGEHGEGGGKMKIRVFEHPRSALCDLFRWQDFVPDHRSDDAIANTWQFGGFQNGLPGAGIDLGRVLKLNFFIRLIADNQRFIISFYIGIQNYAITSISC
jgi:hypothetical protein